MHICQILYQLFYKKVKNLIYAIRGKQVMIDSDVANIYHCETKYVNRVVKRNIERFPEEFCFQLNENEFEVLRCQFVTLNENGRGKYKKIVWLPQDYRFTTNKDVLMNIQRKFKMYKIKGTCFPYQYFIGRNGEKTVIAIKGRFSCKIKQLKI